MRWGGQNAVFGDLPVFSRRTSFAALHFSADAKKDAGTSDVFPKSLMGGQGIEPWTHGLRVRCSAS